MNKRSIVVFQGGLGNQLFQYLYIRRLLEEGFSVTYINNVGKSHNGFELIKYFEVDIKKASFLYNLLFSILKNLRLLNNRMFFSSESNLQYDKLFQIGYWQNRKYFPSEFSINFKINISDEKNTNVLDKIKKNNSVFLHVRRGDYLQPPHNKRFAGICTEAYYETAIKMIKTKFKDVVFFVFSNDMKWTKENIKISSCDCYYIDWNHGDNSIYDMYLMSLCKGGILANSTFSYWGAYLGDSKYIVYPQKWFNDIEAPNIFPDTWKGI